MLTASLKRISDLEDHLDLMKDEFQRIKALTDDPEILGLCDRAAQSTTQKVSVIRQRDSAEAELTKLKSDVERLRTRLKDAEKIIGHAEFHHAIGCVILRQQIQDFKARALEETK